MFSSIMRRPLLYEYNQKLRRNSLNSTYESIKKKIERNDEERKSKHVQFNLVTTNSSSPSLNNPFIPVLVFLSISSLAYYFYNSKK